MPRFVSSPEDHSARFSEWKGYVENMSDFSIRSGLTHALSEEEIESKSKYTRFMAFTREWIYAVIKGNYGYSDSLHPSEHDYLELTNNRTNDDWLKDIMKVKNGKELGYDFPFPTLYRMSEGDCVYDVFMPAYRALKESFDKRSIWQWFTNHSQYTAERDAIKALEGTMMALTRNSMEEIKAAYSEYRQQLPNYEPDTLSEKTKEFEAQPKLRIPVSETQRVKFEKVTNERNFERSLKSEIYEVLKDLPTIDHFKSNITLRITDISRDDMTRMCNDVDTEAVKGPEQVAERIKAGANTVFITAFGQLKREHFSGKDAIIKAQKITDVILKRYFPSLFADGKYAEFADNYILGNKEIFASMLERGHFSSIKEEDRAALVDEIYNEVHGIEEPAPENATEVKSEEVKPEEIKSENIAEIDDVKVPLDLSAEFSEKPSVETSPEIKESSAPVIEGAKLS